MVAAVEAIRGEPGAAEKNRTGVLLSNRNYTESTQTLTHVLWALFNVLPPHSVQVSPDLPAQCPRRPRGLDRARCSDRGHGRLRAALPCRTWSLNYMPHSYSHETPKSRLVASLVHPRHLRRPRPLVHPTAPPRARAA